MNPLPLSLSGECRKAQKILQSFVDPSNGLDGVIPNSVLKKAKGFALFSVFRIGFLMSARAGSGIVIAKDQDGKWTAPAAIGIGGLGGGFSAGAENTDFLVVLNSRAAVKSFMATGSLRLGGNLSLAAGPLGRSAEASGSISSSGGVAAMFSYSKSKGLYAGISLEGTVLVDRSDANSKAYGRNCTAKQILSGSIQTPMFAQPLVSTIERITFTGTEVNGHGRDKNSFTQDNDEFIGRSAQESDFFGPNSPSNVRRDSTSYFEKTDNLDFQKEEKDWTDSQRRRRNEAETRNLGSYAFGGSNSNSSSTNSPLQSTSYSSKKEKANDYFNDADPFGESTGNSKSPRPKGGRSTSSSSFSFLSRSSNKSPVNNFKSQKPPSPVANRSPINHQNKRASQFPTTFSNNSSSSEDESGKVLNSTSEAISRDDIRNRNYDYDSDGFTGRGGRDSSSLDSWNGDEDRNSGSRNAAASSSGNLYSNGSIPNRDLDTTPRPFSSFNPEGNGPGINGGGRKLSTNFDGLDSLDKELQGLSTTSSPRRDQDRTSSPSTNKSYYKKNGNSEVNWRSMSYGGSSAFGNGDSGKGWGIEDEHKASNSNGTRIGNRIRAFSGSTKKDPFATLYDDELESQKSGSRNGSGWGSGKLKGYSGSTPRGVESSTLAHQSLDNSSTPLFDSNSSYNQPPTPATNTASVHINGRVVALFDFKGQQVEDLTFDRGDVIAVTGRTGSREDWWTGILRGKVGSFPANYTEDI